MVVVAREEKRLRRRVREARALFESYPSHWSEIGLLLAEMDLERFQEEER